MQHFVSGLANQHPIAVYTAARVGLFFAVLLPMYLAGMRGILLLIVAFLGSGALSLVLLDGVRSRFSGRMSGYFTRLNDRIDDAARAEDKAADDERPDPHGPDARGADPHGPDHSGSAEGSAEQPETESESQAGEEQRQ